MSAAKAVQRKTGKKVTQVKEKQAAYSVPTARTKKALAVQEAHMEFHIVLPDNNTVDRFTDDLIELVEAYQGSVGGGTSSKQEAN